MKTSRVILTAFFTTMMFFAFSSTVISSDRSKSPLTGRPEINSYSDRAREILDYPSAGGGFAIAKSDPQMISSDEYPSTPIFSSDDLVENEPVDIKVPLMSYELKGRNRKAMETITKPGLVFQIPNLVYQKIDVRKDKANNVVEKGAIVFLKKGGNPGKCADVVKLFEGGNPKLTGNAFINGYSGDGCVLKTVVFETSNTNDDYYLIQVHAILTKPS